MRLSRSVVGLPFGVVSSVFGRLGGYLVDDLQCTHAVLQDMGIFIFTSLYFYLYTYIFFPYLNNCLLNITASTGVLFIYLFLLSAKCISRYQNISHTVFLFTQRPWRFQPARRIDPSSIPQPPHRPFPKCPHARPDSRATRLYSRPAGSLDLRR